MNELRIWLEQNSQRQLAEALGITQGAISQWLRNGQLPLERVRDIERVTGIPAEKLRPDHFGRPAVA